MKNVGALTIAAAMIATAQKSEVTMLILQIGFILNPRFNRNKPADSSD